VTLTASKPKVTFLQVCFGFTAKAETEHEFRLVSNVNQVIFTKLRTAGEVLGHALFDWFNNKSAVFHRSIFPLTELFSFAEIQCTFVSLAEIWCAIVHPC